MNDFGGVYRFQTIAEGSIRGEFLLPMLNAEKAEEWAQSTKTNWMTVQYVMVTPFVSEEERDLALFEHRCKSHDWYYQMSDDHSVWKRGSAERNSLKAEMERLGPKARAIFDAIKPTGHGV